MGLWTARPTYLSLLFSSGHPRHRGGLCSLRAQLKDAAGALIARVAPALLVTGLGGQQLGVELTVWRGGRGGQDQRFQRSNFGLENVDLGARDNVSCLGGGDT